MDKPQAPISLTDDQLTEVFRLASPLRPDQRAAFLEDVAAALSQAPHLEDGVVYRVCRESQRKFFDPPDFSVAGAPARWDYG
jgi:hypothetical protein